MAEQQRTPPWARLVLGGLVVIWLILISQLMIVDVWDETEGMDLIERHGTADLLLSNFRQADAGGVVLFRPIPFIISTAVVKMLGAEAAWRVLRWCGVLLLLTSLGLILALLGEIAGKDPVRDVLMTVVFLFSGAAMVTAGWFATLFDSSTLVLVTAGLLVLARGRTRSAGVLLGLGFFCKETAVLVFPVLAALTWTGALDRRRVFKTGAIVFAFFVVYVAARLLVVAPGSAHDVHAVSVGGILAASLRLPETLWWQVADLPVRGLGWAVFVASLLLLRSWRAAVGVLGIVVVSAVIYGDQVHIGDTPLLSADAFIGRLYLVPAALVALILAVHGRRAALAVVLFTVIWGAVQTWVRHRDFQLAYRDLYALAQPVGEEPLRIDSWLYRKRTFHDRRRGLVLGTFPGADWEFRRDGTLHNRRSK